MGLVLATIACTGEPGTPPTIGTQRAAVTVTNGGIDLVEILGVQPARIEALSDEQVPPMVGGDAVADPQAVVALGKAFFWDVQVGSDDQTACASCHWQAGVDRRVINTVHPGPDNDFKIVVGPGTTWSGEQFNAAKTDDVIGSQGVTAATYHAATGSGPDECTPGTSSTFGGHRLVTGRNAPTTIAAVLNKDNFWDGRADDVFNGVDPFGPDGAGTASIRNASLASQAVGPPLNDVEMSCAGRPFNGPNSLATRLLDRQPLALQEVAANDGALAPYREADGTGLVGTYRDLIARAYGSTLAEGAEDSFSRIWGQAIQAYEATLIPDEAPIDHYLNGAQGALTPLEEEGLGVFTGRGRNLANLCANCHHGPAFTDATVAFVDSGEGNFDDADVGFHNLGVSATAEDPGRAPFAENGHPRNAGSFKTPTLRNVALTAPYFHDGSAVDLAEVVKLYDRGGNVGNPEKSRVIPAVAKKPGQLRFNDAEMTALVAFLRGALTDCRVAEGAAPFDHPSLPLPNGTSLPKTGASGDGSACGGVVRE